MAWKERLMREKVAKWLFKQSLPLGFLLAIIVSMCWPEPGKHVAHWMVNGWKVVTTTNMAVIFFIFGLTLDSSELMTALRAWRAIVLGLTSMLVLTPLTGFVSLLMPFRPYEFALGLAVMACVPTSLSSGVTLVIGGYGNGALALLFTVSGNILGIVTAPLAVKLVLGSQTDAHVDSADLLVKLGVSILLPLLAGKALRELVPPLRRAVPAYKVPLYLINNLQITMIVWQKISAAHGDLVRQEIGDVLLAAFAAVLLHFVFLFVNVLLSWLLRFPEGERKAIIIMASQKNLPTAATIISYFDSTSVGNLGLITIPCIVFYIMQLFIDSALASTWASKYERLAAAEATYSEQLKALEATSGKGRSGGSSSSGGMIAASGGDATDGERIRAGAAPSSAAVTSGGRGAARLSTRSSDGSGCGLEAVQLNDVNPLLERRA